MKETQEDVKISVHNQLVLRAEKWLNQQNCKVVIRDPFKAYTTNGEQPDAIGWRDGLSILIECKSSRADFLADKKKNFRVKSEIGMGDWRFYMCPPDVIKPHDLPEGWGLLYVAGKQVKKAVGFPKNTQWWAQKPFDGCKRSENMMLVSALRRLSIRGYLPEIYDGVPLHTESK